MTWKELSSETQLADIKERSATIPQIIFKHSTRCSISSMAKNRLDKEETPANVDFYYLDLLQYRSLSNKLAEVFDVYHESPQILVIKNGQCVYDESHSAIRIDDILEHAGLEQ